ncbi:GNAT family N-acetyltransferase [Aneurinibacillus sp. REN35]|uniref:GNAT family N-acetyltransferase n=1 Tax=Aneurinibacillus sp. REN35 TaxID=3237286 RepID=UPI003528D01E
MTHRMLEIQLRDVTEEDLPLFFEHQVDATANHMAAFTAKDPTDKKAFFAHWAKIMNNENIMSKTILFNGDAAGHIIKFEQFGQPEVTYWIGAEYWGKGMATKALSSFLRLVKERPLYARAAKDNLGSIRVLKKCGFILVGEDKGFANARGQEIEEFLFEKA